MADSNNITLKQLRTTLNKIKEKLDGKADNQHGTHVSYQASAKDLVPGGSGSSGSSASVSRGDHVHALPAYPTALKSPGTLTLSLNGTDDHLYDGSKDLYLTVSHSEVGAAPVYHATSSNMYGVSTTSAYGHAKASTTPPFVASSASVGSETSSFARGDHVHPAQTSVSGNAGSATKLQTGRTLTIGDAGKSFNGSADVTWTLAEMGAASVLSVERATDDEVNKMIAEVLSGTYK